MTWVLGLLLLASFLYPVIAASAHHSAAQTRSIEVTDGSAMEGLRPALKAVPRAGERGVRPDHGGAGGKELIPAPTVPVDAAPPEVFSVGLAARVPVQPAALPFAARGPPASRD